MRRGDGCAWKATQLKRLCLAQLMTSFTLFFIARIHWNTAPGAAPSCRMMNMSDQDFKLAVESAQADRWYERYCDLKAELEDVRQQRETLKRECAVLKQSYEHYAKGMKNWKNTAQAKDKQISEYRAELQNMRIQRNTCVEEGLQFKAECARRGEMLRSIHDNTVNSAALNKEQAIWKLGVIAKLTAPVTSTSSTGADCPADD